MKFLSGDTNYQFLALRKPAAILSGAMLLISLLLILTRGLSFGIDFTGGTVIEVGYPQAAELDPIRAKLAEAGFEDAVVQHFGEAKEVLIRIAPRGDLSSAQLSDEVIKSLREAEPKVEMRRQEFVGPQVGEELTEDGGLAVLYALIGILVYVSLRFEKRFALGAVAALVHDVIITIGFFALVQIEFNLYVLSAILAVIGYSLNDTIVVFDRIRENFRLMRKGSPEEIINASLNQTLSRTLMTSFTTLLVLFALLTLGGESNLGFSSALIVGIFVGTYSSIYVASAVALSLGISKEDLMPVQKEGAEEEGLNSIDGMP